MFDQKTINALAYLRLKASSDDSRVSLMIHTLDNAGVFAALDEQTGYASALDVLAESALDQFCNCKDPDTSPCIVKGHQKLDPAEWGDTLRPARQLSGRESVSDPSMDDMARAAREIENLRPKGRGPAGA